MTYQEAWARYCAIKEWRQAGKKVNWQYEIDGDTLYIYFQGSVQTIDWFRDFMIWPIKRRHNLWHYGFWKSYHEVNHDLAILANRIPNIKTEWILIGYSSGGVLVNMFANITSSLFSTTVFTFASPRFSWIKKQKSKADIINIHLDRDIVPKLLMPLGYRENPGREIVLKSPYHSPIKSHYPKAYSDAISKGGIT